VAETELSELSRVELPARIEGKEKLLALIQSYEQEKIVGQGK
jgi:hypothetical protein